MSYHANGRVVYKQKQLTKLSKCQLKQKKEKKNIKSLTSIRGNAVDVGQEQDEEIVGKKIISSLS